VARLLLLRHGQSVWNAEHRWQGWADPPLSPLGEVQAAQAARWLATEGYRFGSVACSDLDRAQRTAGIIAAALGLAEPTVDPALRERDVGDWGGLTTAEIEQKWPEVLARWRAGLVDATPGGEAGPVFLDRLRHGLLRLAKAVGPAAAHGVVVITHGGSIRMLERAFGMEPCVVANLCGRWVSVVDGELFGGDRVVVTGLDAPPQLAAD